MWVNYKAAPFRVGGWYLHFVVPLLLMACGSTPHFSGSTFTQGLLPSRDGKLLFRLPGGWINATREAPSPDQLIWLVRRDHAVMLVVRRVTLEETIRHTLDTGGLRRIAGLLLSLASKDGNFTILKPPALFVVSGLSAFRYSYTTGASGDLVQVALLEAGGGVYEVSARATGPKSEEESVGILRLQEDFIGSVVW